MLNVIPNITRRAAFAIMIALSAIAACYGTATAQSPPALERNFSLCSAGYSCDKSLLTPAQTAQVQQRALERNVSACSAGYSCDKSLLTPAQTAQIQEKATSKNGVAAPACAENGSCYGDISAGTGRAKTVDVDGYYRKDGTYVRGHYRSPPKRKRQ